MNETIVILGGAGFLGRAIGGCLRSGGKRVLCADVRPPEGADILFLMTDVLHLGDVKNACESADIVVNCTGQVTSPLTSSLRVNSVGTINIARACRDLSKKLVHFSSVAVYGTADVVDEYSPLNPETAYAACKSAAELILQELVAPSFLTIFRTSNLYGPGQQRGVIAYLLRSAASQERLCFNNDGTLTRFYLHSLDCAEAVERFIGIGTPPGIFNLAGASSKSIRQIIALVEKIAGIRFEADFASLPPHENIRELSGEKLSRLIGSVSRREIEEYLKFTLGQERKSHE